MSGIIEYGWRRFNSQQITTGTNENFASCPYRGGCFWWIGEIAGQVGFPTNVGGGPSFYSGYGINISARPSDEENLVIVGAQYLSGNLTPTNYSPWESMGYTTYTGTATGNYSSAIWKADSSDAYQNSPDNRIFRNYSYVFLNGTLRQWASGNETTSGEGMNYKFPKAPLNGSLILAFNSPGYYFWGQSYQFDPNISSYNDNWGPYTYHYWTLLTDDISYDGYRGSGYNSGGLVSTRWFATFYGNNGSGEEISEGWTTEELSLKGRVVTISGNPSQGSISVYDSLGNRLTYGDDWSWYSTSKNQIKINSLVSTSYVTVTYLNVQSRLRYGYRSRVLTDPNTTHDRIRFNDVRGF